MAIPIIVFVISGVTGGVVGITKVVNKWRTNNNLDRITELNYKRAEKNKKIVIFSIITGILGLIAGYLELL